MADLKLSIKGIKGHPDAGLLELAGAIDSSTLSSLQNAFDNLRQKGRVKLILDFGLVKYVNSTGLSLLIKQSDAFAAAGGGLALVRVPPKVKIVFDMLGFQAFFQIFGNEREAFLHLETAAPAAPPPPPPPAAPERLRLPAPGAPQVAPLPVFSPPAAATPAETAADATAAPAGFPASVRCTLCQVTLRIAAPGAYHCPRCLSAVEVGPEGAARFASPRFAPPIRVTTPSAPDCVENLQDFLASLARRMLFPEGAISDLKEALGEAMRNIVERAYGGDCGQSIQVYFSRLGDSLVIHTVDFGRALNGVAPPPPFPACEKNLDGFEIRANPRGGNILKLVKKKG